MPSLQDMLDQLNQATGSVRDQISSSGIQDMTIKDLLNAPFDYARSASTPSVGQYARCKEKNGVDGWDATGAWKCLFPGADHPKVFYSDYRDFLEARHKEAQAAAKERAYKFIAPEDAKGKTITGRTVKSQTFIDENGKERTAKSTITYFEDGTATKESKESNGWFWNNKD